MADAGQYGTKGLALVSQARVRFGALPERRRQWLMVGAGLLIASVAAMVWYAGRPDWRVLFSGLDGKDVAQVSQELAAAGIAFQATPDGTGVEVPAELLDKARMEVATKGMPQSGRLGFELFDKPNWVGSEFDERVNYQRALEGELEHTIETLGVVRAARVHLVLPQASLFTSEEKVAKASVVLKLKRASLAAEQVESIRNLVAGAVKLEHTMWKPRTTEEMHRLESLAQAAVGFDEKRGDQVVMENVGFSANAPEVKTAGVEAVLEQAKGLLATQPATLKTGLMGLLGVMLVWFVLRPVAGQLAATMREPALLSAGAALEEREGGRALGEAAGSGGGPARLGGAARTNWMETSAANESELVRESRAGQGVYDQVSEHIRRDPAQSTRVLETWISSDGAAS